MGTSHTHPKVHSLPGCSAQLLQAALTGREKTGFESQKPPSKHICYVEPAAGNIESWSHSGTRTGRPATPNSPCYSCVSGTKMQGYTKQCPLPLCAKRLRDISSRVGRKLYVWTPSFGESPSADNPPGSLDVLFQLTQFLTELHQRQAKEPKAVKAHTAARGRSAV